MSATIVTAPGYAGTARLRGDRVATRGPPDGA
jgi:hypothetical protein